MNLTLINPKKSLNKAFLKEKVSRYEIGKFKMNLGLLLNRINESESEEHLKNLVSDFLKDTWYKEHHEINTKGRNDLVIHVGKSSREPVGVIIETKRPSNKAEMVSAERPNAKAMHELLLYYLKERVDFSNINIRYLIVTNIYEWFIIDEVWFEKNVYRNNKLKKDYENWKLNGKDTKFFYENIARPFFDLVEEPAQCIYIDIRSYQKFISSDENKLIPLYKILSPTHLLKQPFKNDSNSLDVTFYNELLYIIGLRDREVNGKRLITREEVPNSASLLENTIVKLKSKESYRNVHNLTTYGNTKDEQLFNIALELCITWINRILFLKLLEAQLFKYHKHDKRFLFLNNEKIFDFDELSNLFFEVLSVRPANRAEYLKEKYSRVPYLNSSLFERTTLEKQTFDIGALDNRLPFPLLNETVLKDERGRRKTSDLPTLQYLFKFLEAYDFTSVGKEEIQEDNKSLINASVLGLIFEKINGYKDGSFFTPGFVTMHMCKKAIREVVVKKFNDQYGLSCENLDDVKNFIASRYKSKDILEFNALVNSLKVCDPAVGSGHFLVSALNEIIFIKEELGILADEQGVRLSGFEVKVENDELIVTYNDNTEIFEYTVSNHNVSKDVQRVQKTIFHEKETIIENCLFGVDINPNSAKICSLRLWIELLKSAYYTEQSSFTELETLPNIDINIKCGNSLINRLELDDDLKQSLKKVGYSLQDYKQAVRNYKAVKDKEKKGEILEIIDKIKGAFQSSLDEKFIKKISKARGKVVNLESEINRKKQWKEIVLPDLTDSYKDAKKALSKAEDEKKSILENVIYQNSFEWRFEFPEVLDDDGNFIGFDLVIGNPPYISLESFSNKERDFFRRKYKIFERKFETSVLFIVEGFNIIKEGGLLAYIAPVTWQTGENYQLFRHYMFNQRGIVEIINLPFNIFPDAYVDTAIYFLTKSVTDTYRIYSYNKKDKVTSFENINFSLIDKQLIASPKFKIILNPFVNAILSNLPNEHTTLGQITDSTQGLSGSNFKPVERADPERHFPFLSDGNVYNYFLEVKEVFYTSLDDKPTLKKFYGANPKLLIRRIINRQDRLSVAYTDKKMVFKKDINPFIPNDERFHPKFLLTLIASRLISYIYLNISSIAQKDDFRQTTLSELRELPIPVIDSIQQRPFVILADYILTLSNEKRDFSFFERLIDAMVYELYLGQQIEAGGGGRFLTYLFDLPELAGDHEKDIRIIERVYKDLSSSLHPIASSLHKLINIKEIALIEGRK